MWCLRKRLFYVSITFFFQNFQLLLFFSILDILKKNYLLWDELNFKYEKFFKMEFYFFVCELFIDVFLFVIGENKQIF